MTKPKSKELRPQQVVVHFTTEDHELLKSIAKDQGRTISGQAYFWLQEKLKLRKENVKKEVFFNGKP